MNTASAKPISRGHGCFATVIGASLIAGACATSPEPELPALKTVDHVDLVRYAGIWYEIAKLPNRFQRSCERDATAEYALGEPLRLAVVNRCMRADGELDEAHGIARVVDTETNARLEVSFVDILGINIFWGDYWIIDLDAEYRYAVVGHPSRDYAWVLSRTPALDDDVLVGIKARLAAQGYDPQRLEPTRQSDAE